MENNYKFFAFKYIYEKLNMKSIEEKLSEEGIQSLDYQNQEEEMYKSISRFFVLKNHTDISSLTEEEKESFKKYFSIPIEMVLEDKRLLNEINEFILRTYQKVLFPKIEENHCYYGPININYVAPRDSIVLGFRYYEFNIDENFEEEHDRQQDIICDILNDIQFNLAQQLKITIAVIKYNELYKTNDNELKLI